MNKFLIGLAFILPLSFGVKALDVNYRPYISTRMAKVLMQKDVKPDDEDVEELCDGSGFITHGDGHKTECPGCPACKNKEPLTSSLEDATIEEPLFYVYYMGAKWCGPCQRMKAETLSNKSVLEFIESKGIELIIYEETNPAHKSLFRLYNIKLLPTILIVDPKDPTVVRYRSSGFLDAERMLKLLKEKSDEEQT
tara:strand:+ start:2435 stop:3019 length:585 start_codon:yes stop_codon:yes gene_type:complete